jgi:hypothetical protein
MRRTVRTAAGIAAAATIAFVAASCGGSTDLTPKQYVANPLPSLEQPPKTTTGTGVVNFVDNGTEIDWTMSLTGVTNVTQSHIHVGSTAVASGPIIINLFFPNRPPETGTLNGFVASGTITNANNASVSLDSLRVLFNNGNAYVNIHTVANTGGEIRDQIRPAN